MITSTANTRVKWARSLRKRETRYAEQAFLLEGARLVADALTAGLKPRVAFYTSGFADSVNGARLVRALTCASAESLVVSDAVMGSLADTVTPQGVLVVASFPDLHPAPDTWMTLVLDAWQDPGNLGTVLRSAEAAGVGRVMLSPGCVDPFNPKTVRAGMGVHFRLPMTLDAEWVQIDEALQGRSVALADMRGDIPYDRHDWTQRSALIVGGEAHGAGDPAERLAHFRVAVPMQSPVESVNAAVAASVILFEAARQRRSSLGPSMSA